MPCSTEFDGFGPFVAFWLVCFDPPYKVPVWPVGRCLWFDRPHHSVCFISQVTGLRDRCFASMKQLAKTKPFDCLKLSCKYNMPKVVSACAWVKWRCLCIRSTKEFCSSGKKFELLLLSHPRDLWIGHFHRRLVLLNPSLNGICGG